MILLFWVLLILAVVGALVPYSHPYYLRGWYLVVLIEIAILGHKALGFPA